MQDRGALRQNESRYEYASSRTDQRDCYDCRCHRGVLLEFHFPISELAGVSNHRGLHLLVRDHPAVRAAGIHSRYQAIWGFRAATAVGDVPLGSDLRICAWWALVILSSIFRRT